MSRIALYLPSFDGGGLERVMLHLAEGFLGHGHQVDLVVNKAGGAYADQVPEGARVVVLDRALAQGSRLLALRAAPMFDWKYLARPVLFSWRSGKHLAYLASLIRYLREQQPDGLIAANPPCNLNALWARRLAGVPTRVMVTEHNMLSVKAFQKGSKKNLWRARLPLIGRTYVHADVIVAVSDGVADDLSRHTGVSRDLIHTIYNPVVSAELMARAREPFPHPWLATPGEVPVILATGRLAMQKNFPLLLQAFALLRQQRPARLLILGEGGDRAKLESLIEALGIGNDVELPGFVSNPYAAFASAQLFVLSSAYEGLGNVLIEAMACGCPVVSTNCPSGPSEILDDGRWGELVPLNDATALCNAMQRTLDAPLPAEQLRNRAAEFSVESGVENYLNRLFAS